MTAHSLVSFWADRQNKHRALTGILIGLLLIRPAVPVFVTSIIFLFATVASALILAEDKRRTRVVLTVLGVPTLSWAVVDKFFPNFTPSIAHGMVGTIIAVFIIAFLVYSGCVILFSLLRATSITRDEIFGIINFYLILGFIWAYVYVVVEDVWPQSFDVPLAQSTFDAVTARSDVLVHKFIYFSFVTMTTVGYGDILPRTELAETLAVTQAINGQLYVAVAVAYLLSLHFIEFRPGDRGRHTDRSRTRQDETNGDLQ